MESIALECVSGECPHIRWVVTTETVTAYHPHLRFFSFMQYSVTLFKWSAPEFPTNTWMSLLVRNKQGSSNVMLHLSVYLLYTSQIPSSISNQETYYTYGLSGLAFHTAKIVHFMKIFSSWRTQASGNLCSVALVRTDNLEERSASIIRVLIRATLRIIPKDGILNSHRRDDLKFYTLSS
jgi:hypothetical protein